MFADLRRRLNEIDLLVSVMALQQESNEPSRSREEALLGSSTIER